MEYQHILGRIRAAVRRGSYLVPSAHAPAPQRKVLGELAQAMADPDADPDAIRTRIHQLHASGRIDRVMKLSALGVLAASPHVKDYAEASRLAGQQEFVALEEGGENADAYVASAHRHRGVVCYLLGHDAHALDWFTRAFERERTAENLGNVLAVLIRLGELDEAREHLQRIRSALAADQRLELERRVAEDDDLVRLRETLAH